MNFRSFILNPRVRALSRALEPIIPFHKQRKIAIFLTGGLKIFSEGALRASEKAKIASVFLDGEMLLIDDGGSFREAEECDLVIICAFKGRHELLELVVRESFCSKYSDSIRWVLVGSTDEDSAFLRRMSRDGRIFGAIVANDPIGRKWQTGVKIAGDRFNSRLYCINGSDDLLPHCTIDNLIDYHLKFFGGEGGAGNCPGLYCCMEWMVLDICSTSLYSPALLEVSYVRRTAFQPLGAGRFYTKEFLMRNDFTIFDSRLRRLLDDRGFEMIQDQECPVEYYGPERFGPVISVKGDWPQMNSTKELLDAITVDVKDRSFGALGWLTELLDLKTVDELVVHARNDLFS